MVYTGITKFKDISGFSRMNFCLKGFQGTVRTLTKSNYEEKDVNRALLAKLLKNIWGTFGSPGRTKIWHEVG